MRITLLAGLVLALVSACGIAPTRWEPPPEVHRAESLAAQGRLPEAAALYWEAAERAPRDAAFDLRLRAVETLLTADTLAQARSYLSRMQDTAPTPDQALRLQIAEARIALLEGDPARALEQLPATPPTRVAAATAARTLDLRAEALAALGRTREAIDTRLRLATQAPTTAVREENEDKLWALLSGLPFGALDACRREASQVVLAGWCALAWIARRATDEAALAAELEAWRSRHAAHPAAARFPQRILGQWRALRVQARKVAVLLPLTGPLAGPGQAIADGLMTAYYAGGGDEEIRFYDTGGDPERAVARYSQALADGADAIIGPLAKRAVQRLINQARIDVPTLTLNYLPDPETQTPDTLYQFGLLPEDEMRALVRRMGRKGKQRSIGFVSEGAWGERMLRTLESELVRNNGILLESRRLASGQTDFSVPIRQALLLDESRSRYDRLRALLRRDIRFEPRRRGDVQVIALAAPAVQARLVQPQLRFYFAGDLPVYATSRIYTGHPNPFADSDLDGVEFCDAPLVLGSDAQARQVRAMMEGTIAESLRRRPRLAALGFDAWSVLPELRLLESHPEQSFSGVTGRLSIPMGRRIARALDWARFENGRPVPLRDSVEGQPAQTEQPDLDMRLLPATPGAPLPEAPAPQPIPMGMPQRPEGPHGPSTPP